MPQYAVEPGWYPGSLPLPFWPCDIVDSKGEYLDGRTVWFDTDTGISIKQAVGADGNTLYSDGISVTIQVINPPPLTIIPYEEVKPDHIVGGN